MSGWIDVPVAEVAVGDECKVDGYGRGNGDAVVDVGGKLWYYVYSVSDQSVWLRDVAEVSVANFRRSSIVAVRRSKPEPSPKPGDWRCRTSILAPFVRCWSMDSREPCGRPESREVFRASGGWSRDTRDGQPWVMKDKAPVEITVQGLCGDVINELERRVATFYREPGYYSGGPESWADYYKRIGLDVRPVDRRGKR